MLIVVVDSRDENFVRCVVKDISPSSLGKIINNKPEEVEVEDYLTDQIPDNLVQFEYVDLADY